MADRGVLLIDWENLAGAILGRGKTVEAAHVSAIWDFANRRSGGHLQAHMAAAHFDASIDAQMSEHLIEREVVRSTKEQADILLTVLSMDYLNSGVRNFILVTGDQDFVPLITRLRRDNCRVVVVYGDPGRLSPELTRTLATAGVESIDIADLTQLKERKSDTSVRSLLGLLELTRKGYILGGRENGERVALLASWGIIENTEESQYWEVVSANTEKVTRQSAAARRGDKWLPASATRTYLALNSERVKEVFAADFLVRYLSSRPGGLGIAALRRPCCDRIGSRRSRWKIRNDGRDNVAWISGAAMARLLCSSSRDIQTIGGLDSLWHVSPVTWPPRDRARKRSACRWIDH
jgi:hypothetical protein